MQKIYKKILEIQRNNELAVLCTIVATKGSTPLKAGAKMLVWPDKTIYGTIGGGRLESAVIEDAVQVLKEEDTQLFAHDLLQQHGMCCGGNVQVFIEKIRSTHKLYVFGTGHVGKAVVRHACEMDFDIYAIDHRKAELDKLSLPRVNKLQADYHPLLESLPFDEETYIVIMTNDHQTDRDILAYCIKQPHTYLGMIGSKRKVAVTRKQFLSAQIATEPELDGVDMPIGLDIKAQTPDEIAVSILGKIIQRKNEQDNETSSEKMIQDAGILQKQTKR